MSTVFDSAAVQFTQSLLTAEDERNQYLRDQLRLCCNGFDLLCPV